MRQHLELTLKIVCGLLVVLLVMRVNAELRPGASLGEVKVPNLADLASPEEKSDGGKSSPKRPSRSSKPKLPSHITARVDAVYESQILGTIKRPMPMALLGIIGDNVDFRGPKGKSKLLSVGDELDGVKIIKIGINRVLVEEDGKQKELTLHSGYGSDSLMPKKSKP